MYLYVKEGKLSYKGRFRPKHPEKYQGNPSNIVYRSLWEFKFFRYLDEHPDVMWWASEEYIVPYVSPIDGKVHRYFPDVVLRKKTAEGTLETVMIEIKPKKQTMPPDIAKRNATPTGRVSRRYIREVKTFGVNDAKWNAARKYCMERGWHFEIITEADLGIR
jgi:hypothetical protein